MEWEGMEAVPDDLRELWVSVLCPAGARCIVVASKVHIETNYHLQHQLFTLNGHNGN